MTLETTVDFHSGIESVDAAHRVLNLGVYDVYISSCGVCDSAARIDVFGEDCIGFGVPTHPGSSIYNKVVVVFRCPECFERQWCHTTVVGGYYTYLRHLNALEKSQIVHSKRSLEQKE